ncbi:hypothetical protein TNCV_4618901 [Trichonephila clavipes]|nr:hypothetical protein TNCV_4618901 [Trichonephila clavipes]
MPAISNRLAVLAEWLWSRTRDRRVRISSFRATKDPPCREGNEFKSVCVESPPVDVMWQFREGMPELRCRPHHLTEVQNDEVRH